MYRIRVFDKAFGFKDFIGAPLRVKIHLRHNVASSATLTLDADDPKAAGLADEGARVVIERGGEHMISGPVSLVSGKGPSARASLTFSVEDDVRVLQNVLAWPVPTGAVTGNSVGGQTVEYYTITGNAETVIKDVVGKNARDRLGLPLTIAANQNRGGTVAFTGRFHTLSERLFPAVDQAGIGLTVRQSGAGLLLDVYTPRTFTPTLSEESGTLTDWSYTTSAPKNTRVIVGGAGEGTNRVFRQYVDTARETAWGDKIEVFRDARDTSTGDIYQARANETLAEGAPLSGFKLTLSETENFRYGNNGVRVGDRVTVRMGSLTVTDILREATLVWDADNGETITPIVGERSDDPGMKLAKELRALKADNNDRKAR